MSKSVKAKCVMAPCCVVCLLILMLTTSLLLFTKRSLLAMLKHIYQSAFPLTEKSKYALDRANATLLPLVHHMSRHHLGRPALCYL